MSIQLAQSMPGQWHLYHDDEPVFDVPSWFIEHIPQIDRGSAAHFLARIYGQGRLRGKDEGRTALQEELKQLLDLTMKL